MKPINWYAHNKNFKFMSDDDIKEVVKHFNLNEEEIRTNLDDLGIELDEQNELLKKLLS